jgi:pilus assembly protein CpaC
VRDYERSIRPIGARPRRRWLVTLLLGVVTLAGGPASAQQFITAPHGSVTLARGTSAVLVTPVAISRVSMADPDVAEAVVMSPREVLINGKSLGTTTFVVWDAGGMRNIYGVEVTADAAALGRHLSMMYPEENIDVSARGNTLVLGGRVSSAQVAHRARTLAEGTGATVIDNLETPAPTQILLQVRIAEVSEAALKRLGNQVIDVLNPHRLDSGGDWRAGTDTDGIIQLSLINSDAYLRAIIRALQETGDFKSLAEPNLLALDGQQASFLAGGEFPYPTVQRSDAITIEWREFGVQLAFTPTVTNAGNINLTIAPEVSTLDFAQGLMVAGFQIPAVLTRRALTQVELREGQHLVIAGLMDRSIQTTVRKLPLLGDIPLLGALFRSRFDRQEVTELLIIVSPRIVEPMDDPPAIPTGEPETWEWDRRWDRRLAPPPADPLDVSPGV